MNLKLSFEEKINITLDLTKAVIASSNISANLGGLNAAHGNLNAGYVNALFDGIYKHLSEAENKA